MPIRRIIAVVVCVLAGLAYAQTLPVPTAISPTTGTVTSTAASGTIVTPLTVTNSDGSPFTGSLAITDPSGYTAVVGGPAIVLGPTSLLGSTFNAVAGDATTPIGSLSTSVTSGIAKPVYSLLTTCGAFCADSAKFSVLGNSLKVGNTDVVCTSTTPCSYQITIRDTDTEVGANNVPFDQHLTLTGNIKVNSVLLGGGTTGSFTAPAGPGTSVGALTATCSNGTCGSLTFSTSTTQGGCNATNGANNSSFTVSGASLLVNSGTAAGTYKVCVVASNAAYVNSPLGAAFTITGTTGVVGVCNPSPCPPGSILPAGTTGWVNSFDEEFPGTSINTAVWNVPPDGSIFPSGQTENCSHYLHVNNGTLSITSPGTFGDSCAVNTIATWGFGYYEANVWTGVWPGDWGAFWILSNGNASRSSPPCTPIDNGFEADIIETYGGSAENVYYSGYVMPCAQAFHGQNNGHLAVGDTYHVYGLLVQTTGMTFYIDGVQKANFATTLLPGDTLNEYMILQNIFQSSTTQGLRAHWVRFFHQ